MKKMPFLINARGKRSKKRAKSSRRNAPRKAAAKKRKSSGVPAWVRARGFGSWSAYMESIRPGGTKMAARRRSSRRRRKASSSKRRRRNPVTVARMNAPRRRRRHNPPLMAGIRDIPRIAMQGAIDAGEALTGKAVARLVRGKMNLEGNTTTGSIVEVGVGLAGYIALRRRYGNFAKMFLAGAMMAPLETIVKQSNVPYLSTALGDEGELPLIGDVVEIGGEYYPAALLAGLGGEYGQNALGNDEERLVQ